MHDLATIAKIQKIDPIEGKDRIVLATVNNYPAIVTKDEFKVGDKVIFVAYDAVLPEKPEWEFLRKRCWSEKWKGFRIRAMKMGNVISEGLVVPLSYLGEGDWKVGDVVTDKMEIKRYDPEAVMESQGVIRKRKPENPIVKFLFRFNWFQKLAKKKYSKTEYRGYPLTVPKSDETNIELCYEKIKDVEGPWIKTEKVEGQAAMYNFKLKGRKLKCYSHNFLVNDGSWTEVAKNLDLKNKLYTYCKEHRVPEISISGEIVGPGIQKNIYKKEGYDFYLYNAYAADGRKYDWEALTYMACELGIKTVPYLGTSDALGSVEEYLDDCVGNSVITEGVPREGIVWRTLSGMYHFKAKSRPYKLWFGA